MSYANPDALVSTEWLADHLADDNLIVLDASYFVPGGTGPAKEQYASGHLPGAVFFDINDVADPDADQDHTMPSAAVFGEKVGALGVNTQSIVIVYDAAGGGCAAARVWWMFRAFGHEKVAVLNGGLFKWKTEDRPLEAAVPAITPQTYTAGQDAQPRIRNKSDIQNNIKAAAYQVVDARAAGRFTGTDPEPKAGLRSGHIPNSLNLPWNKLFTPETKTFKSAEGLQAEFDAAGIDLTKPVTTTCGSGVTACTVALGAYLLGKEDVAIYDGSWIDWGSDANTPIVTGPAT